MKMKLLYFVAILILIASCIDKPKPSIEKFYSINQTQKISLPLPKGQVMSANILHFANINDSLHLLVYYYPNMFICDYNVVAKKLVREIKIPTHFHTILNFNYLNEDSILMLGSSLYKFNEDSSVVLMNSKSELSQILGIHHKQIISSMSYPDFIKNPDLPINQEDNYDDIIFPMVWQSFSPGRTEMFERIYMTFINSAVAKANGNDKNPIYGYYDFKEKQLKVAETIGYPDLQSNQYFPRANYSCNVGTHQNPNCKIVSYYYTPKVYVVDNLNHKKDSIILGSKYFEPPKPRQIPFPEEAEMLYPIYHNIDYHSGNNMYIRYISYSPEIMFAVFFDEKFNYIGEEIVDKYFENIDGDFNWITEIVGDSLFLTQWNLEIGEFNSSEFKTRFDSITKLYQKDELCKQEVKSRKSALSLSEYLRTYLKILDNSYSILVIDDNGCPSCVDYTLKFLSANKSVLFNLKDKPLYLLYRSDNVPHANLKRSLKQYDLDKTKRVIFDSLPDYQKFNPFTTNNPRLYLFENQKTILDTIYSPTDMDNIPEQIMKFYNFDTE